MHISRKITFCLLFVAVNLAVSGVSKTGAFETMLSLASPFMEDLGKYNLALLVLTIIINVIFISTIIEITAEQFNMGTYVLTRLKRRNPIKSLCVYSVRCVFIVWGCKVGTDFLFSQMNGTDNIVSAIVIEMSTLLTSFIWLLLVYLFLEIHMKVRWVYFIMISCVIVFQYMSAYIPLGSVFVFGSPGILEMPGMWILLKILCAMLLFLLNCKIYGSYEYYDNIDE